MPAIASIQVSLDQQLTEAAAKGNEIDINDLLKKGASPNGRAAKGMTPLMLAALNGHAGAVKLLLSSGADQSLKDENGSTALNYALLMEHSEIVSLLEGKRYKLTFLIAALLGLMFWPYYKLRYKSKTRRSQILKRLFLFQVILLCCLSGLVMIFNFKHQVLLRIMAEAGIFYMGILLAIASFIVLVITMRESGPEEGII